MNTPARRILGFVIATFLILSLFHFPLQKANASTYLFWNSELDVKKTFQAFEPIVVDEGRLEYFFNCFGPEHGNKGINDWVYTQSDIYIVQHQEKWIPSTAAARTVLIDAGNAPTFVISAPFVPKFSDTLIGSTNRIGNGEFDVIYDECQDGLYNNEDRVFEKAITIEIPQDYKISRFAKSIQEQNKREHSAIGKSLEEWIGGLEVFLRVLKLLPIFLAATPVGVGVAIGAFLIDVYIDKINDTFSDLSLPVYIPTGGLDTGKDILLSILGTTAKKYKSLGADPPDLNYRQPTELADRTLRLDLNSEDPIVGAISNMGKEMNNELVISGALLSSLERFQGAQLDGNAQWGLLHSYGLQDYSKLLSDQIPHTQSSISKVIELLTKDNKLDLGFEKLQEIKNKINLEGFNSTQLTGFRNMNLTNEEIDKIRRIIASTDVSSSRNDMVDVLETINREYDKLRFGLSNFSVAIQDTISEIKSNPLSRYITDVPTAEPGENYSGLQGMPISFIGTSSSSPESNITKYEWDLDGDGKFDDSSIPSPQYAYPEAFHGYVGLRVTNERGVSDVDYAEITISDTNNPPTITNSTPQAGIVQVPINSTQSFTVSASDTDGGSPVIDWFVDDIVSGGGDSFSYTPTNDDFGLHYLTVSVTDQGGKSIAQVWKLFVLFPDMDSDLWRSNTDCNDFDASINPGMKEIFYNGIDDDCNSASIDSDSPPLANNQTLEIFQFSTADIILTGNDVDGYPLNFSITNQPKNGTLSNITIIDPTNGRLTYNPTSKFHGEDKFGFTVNDGNYTSNPALVNITVLIQDPPVAQEQNLIIDEDTSKEIFLNSSSPDGHQLNFSIASKPNGGKLSNITTINSTTAKVTYTPLQDFNSNTTGNDLFSFKVNDGIDPSRRGESQALIQITINPINDAPTTFDKIVTTQEDIPVNITLRGNDPENDLNTVNFHNNGLNFSVIKLPLHGSVSEINHKVCDDCADLGFNQTDEWVTYTPNIDFVGQDQFTFRAGDGNLNGNESDVTITVKPSNSSLPVEFEDGDIFIPDISRIQWRSADGTLNGVLDPITAGAIQKGGAFDSSGNLYITEYNGGVVSKFNKTGDLVGPFGDYFKDYECVPHPTDGSPVCAFWPLAITFGKNGDAYIAGQTPGTNDAMDDIRKFDSNGNLTQKFDVDIENVEQGIHWIELGPDQCTLYYTTATDHVRRFDVCNNKQLTDFADLFNDPSYDRRNDHQPILVIRLLPNGEMLVAQNAIIQHLDTSGKINKTYDITGSSDWVSLALDPDGESFWAGATGDGNVYKFDIDSGKVLQFFATLTPLDNPFGIGFPGGIIIKGEPQPGTTNNAPSVKNQTVIANINEPISVNLTGSDIANDPLTFSILSKPSFGTLGPITKINDNMSKVTYNPNQNSDLSDSFTFNANDGLLNSSNIGKISILMNHPPVARDDVANTVEGNSTNIPILANDTDIDGNKLNIVSVNTSSLIGDIIVNNVNDSITYSPLLTFTGQEILNYTISDEVGANDTAQVVVNVKPLNNPPLANHQNVTLTEDTSKNITLTGSDPNADNIMFSRSSGPNNGSISMFNTTTGILQYTSLRNFHGQDSFTFRVSDGKVMSSPATVNITVTDDGANDPPNAASERTSTERNKPVLIDVLSNDNDPNGDALIIANITGPMNGTAYVNPNQTVTYAPPRNFNGSDQFVYNITDGKGGNDNAQVIVDVKGPSNNAPTVEDQSLFTNKNTPLNITLFGISPSGSLLIYSIVDNAAHGNLSGLSSINNTAAHVLYTPTVNFTGNDLFTFEANNGTLDSNIGTVAIVVNGTMAANAPPIARDDFANTNEDKPILLTVLANDTDTDGDLLSVDSIILQPINGTSIINSNGTVTYSPNTNFFGDDGFNYTISDGRGGNATARVSVTVNSVNDPPLTSNDIATTLHDNPVVIDVLANDTDPEGDALVISAIINPPSNGSAIINSNGTITFSPPSGFSGTDTFDYQVSDDNGGNSTASVLVDVIPAVNKPPVVAISSPINGSQFTEGDPVVFSGSATDPEDGNISSVMTWESSINGQLGIGPNIVSSSLSQGTHSITASAIDSGELSNSSRIEIIVHDFNDPPIAVADHFETNEDTSLNMNVITNDTDPENDALTIAAINPSPNNGQASINNNNTINYTPNQNFNGQDSLTYTVTDGLGGNSTAVVIVDVLPVNDNPIAKNDSTATDKNTAALIAVLANDTDVDNDPLTISQVAKPAHGTASLENGKIKYTPNLSFVGIDEFDYYISDGMGGNSQASVTVNVKSVNQLPVATDGSVNTDKNILLNVKLNASDPDNDPLTYILDTQPTHGSVSGFEANNGTLTYTPLSNFTGQDSLRFKVNDGTADSNVATVLINVKNVNHSPVAENQNVVTNTNKQIEITLKGHDPDSDLITFVKVTDPSHGTIAGFDKDTGKLTYIPSNGYSGPDSFLFKIIDSNKAESNIATVSIIVNAVVNKPPVASNVNVETSQDTVKVITLVGTDPDAGDKITYHIVSAASSGSTSSIDQITGKVTYTPNKGFLGPDSFTYKVTDLGGADSNIATVGITVKSTSPTPYPLPPSCSPNDKTGGKALRGTNSDDVIIGTEAGDSIQGLNGNDAINGCGASDNLNGNAGNDGIAGGTNEDNIHGNNGNDYLRGDAGNDGLYGGEGDDVLVGGPGRDSFYCGSGNDKVLDFNAKEGDALQKQSNTKGTQKSDCENVSSISSTSTSAKSSSRAVPPTPTEKISPRDTRNQSQPITTQSQQSTQKGQNETNQILQNSQPVVTDYTLSIEKNQRVSIILPGNDKDDDKLLFNIINKPQNALIGNFKASSGSLTYTPSKDYVGDDKFTFTASDGKIDSNIGTVTIHVKDKQTIVDQQTESQSSENPVKAFPLIYWRGNMDKTEKLLPLNVGNLTVESAGQVTKVLKISSDNHDIYDNIAAQILTAKFNIKNNVNSCKNVNNVIKYGDEILHSVNYQGAGTATQELSVPQMKNLIKAHSILTQFNIQGCSTISPTDMFFAPNIIEILHSDPFSFFVN